MKIDFHPYEGQRVLVATMHGKEAAIVPPLFKHLGALGVLAQALDTDQLGTFSGEIERLYSPEDTLREKIASGLANSDLKLAIASEGSFGPHPLIPFVALHEEKMMWVDKERGIELMETILTTDTNYDSLILKILDELPDDFLQRVNFPSHRLIVRPHSAHANAPILKGIATMDALVEGIKATLALPDTQQVLIQTDMRAHHNPTRMKVIVTLAEKMALRLKQLCSKCGCPGWGVVRRTYGLPCSDCGRPTKLELAQIYGCGGCGHEEEIRPEAEAVSFAQAKWCDYCNP